MNSVKNQVNKVILFENDFIDLFNDDNNRTYFGETHSPLTYLMNLYIQFSRSAKWHSLSGGEPLQKVMGKIPPICRVRPQFFSGDKKRASLL